MGNSGLYFGVKRCLTHTLPSQVSTMSFSTPITRLSPAMCEFLNISDPEKAFVQIRDYEIVI